MTLLTPRTLAAYLLTITLQATPGHAPPTGAHDFDFEIGNWKTHVARLRRPLSGDTTWLAYDGTSVVKKVWDGAANTVELEVDGPGGQHIRGLSLRLYNPQARQWSINYVNAAVGTMSVPTVGAFTNGRGEFFDWEEYDGRMILVRNVWTSITPTACRFEQSYSDDGGRTWELNWVATDTRLPDEPPPAPDAGPHDFDFELGAWTVQNARLLNPLTDSARWIRFDGTSVARPVWNGRAVLLELASDPPSGHSEGLILRTYDPRARQWNVTFASRGGGVLGAPAIGGFRDGRGEFYALEQLADGRTVLARSVLSDITPTSYRLEQAYSADGGRSWQVNWTSAHTRARTSHATTSALRQSSNPVSNAVRMSAAASSKNLLAAAEAMPDDKFGYKPTAAQMSFGELLVHIRGDNRITCQAIGGVAPGVESAPAPTDAKAVLVAALRRSLDFCDAALARVNDTQLGDTVPYYGHGAPRAVAMIGLVTDWANHYSQQAIYLRLNGLLPPTARKP